MWQQWVWQVRLGAAVGVAGEGVAAVGVAGEGVAAVGVAGEVGGSSGCGR